MLFSLLAPFDQAHNRLDDGADLFRAVNFLRGFPAAAFPLIERDRAHRLLRRELRPDLFVLRPEQRLPLRHDRGPNFVGMQVSRQIHAAACFPFDRIDGRALAQRAFAARRAFSLR